MDTLAQRFRLIRSALELSQPEMSECVQISRNAWQAYELGKSTPTTSVFTALHDMGFSVDWLISGEGKMKLEDASGDLSGYTLLPLYGTVASMGDGAAADDEIVEWIAFSNAWLQLHLRATSGKLVIILGEGDSMLPTIQPGDLLVVDTSKSFMSGDGIYALNLFGNCLVKRLQVHVDGSVNIISDNEAYRPQLVQGDELQALSVIGRVVWHGKKM